FLARENAAVADHLVDAITAFDLVEKPAKPFLGHVRDHAVGIKAGSRPLDGAVAYVCPENLDGIRKVQRSGLLQKGDGQRIHFLARRASRDPDSDAFVPVAQTHQLGEDLALQRFKNGGIAKKTGDADEDVRVKVLDLIRIVADDRQIVFESRHFAKGHSSSNASLDRVRLV